MGVRFIRIGSLTFRTGTLRQLHALLAERPSGRAPGLCIGFLNPHVYNQAASDRRVGEFLESCGFVCLDGIGIAAAGRILNRGPLERLVMDQVFDAALREGRLRGRAVLLGMSQRENDSAVDHLRVAAPDLRIEAGLHGFLEPDEYVAILRKHKDVEFVLVGMGSPKSEAVLASAREICVRAVCWHVGGGTLRNWAGTKRRAPGIVSRMGLEWAHRMMFEPETRNRYTRGIPSFARNIVRDSFTGGG